MTQNKIPARHRSGDPASAPDRRRPSRRRRGQRRLAATAVRRPLRPRGRSGCLPIRPGSCARGARRPTDIRPGARTSARALRSALADGTCNLAASSRRRFRCTAPASPRPTDVDRRRDIAPARAATGARTRNGPAAAAAGRRNGSALPGRSGQSGRRAARRARRACRVARPAAPPPRRCGRAEIGQRPIRLSSGYSGVVTSM